MQIHLNKLTTCWVFSFTDLLENKGSCTTDQNLREKGYCLSTWFLPVSVLSLTVVIAHIYWLLKCICLASNHIFFYI